MDDTDKSSDTNVRQNEGGIHMSGQRAHSTREEEANNADTVTRTSSSPSTDGTSTTASTTTGPSRKSRYSSKTKQHSSSLALEKQGVGARVSSRPVGETTTSTTQVQSTRRVWSSRRRNTETPDIKQPLPSNSRKERSSAAVSFLEEKQNLAHRSSSARTLIVPRQGRSNFNKNVPSPPQENVIMERQNPAADGEEEEYTDVLEYTGIIDAKQHLGEVDTLSTTSSSLPNQLVTRPNTITTNNEMMQAPEEEHSDNNSNDISAAPPSLHRGRAVNNNANRMLRSAYVIEAESGEANEDEEYEYDAEEANSSTGTASARHQEQRYRRTSSHSTGTVMAVPVGDELHVQAHVVGVGDRSQPNLEMQSGRAPGGGDALLERRFRQKTNRMLIRFSILFSLVVIAAAVIVVLVVSNGNETTMAPFEGPATPVSTAPSRAPVTQAPSRAATISPAQYFVFPSALESGGPPTTDLPTGTLLPSQLVRQEEFLAQLQLESPTTSFENTTSPQSKARDWLFFIAEDLFDRFDFDRLFQQFALATFFYATGGETTWNQENVATGNNDGAASEGWLSTSGVAECNWPGLQCDSDNVLVDMDLSDFGLSGTLPPELLLLTKLSVFIAWGNSNHQIGGTIPSQLGLLTDLFRLTLTSNRLEGNIPTELGRLVNLEYLGLGNNDFLTGTIPTEIMLPKLTELTLDNNDLSGPIPTEIGLATALQGLFVDQNPNMLQLPTELGLLTDLRFAFVHDMGCTGTIPSELGYLTSLTFLYLNENQLSGTIFTELGQMTSLEELLLGGNFLEGPLPSGALANLTRLTRLDVASLPGVTGTIPSSLCHANGGNLTTFAVAGSDVTFDCSPLLLP